MRILGALGVTLVAMTTVAQASSLVFPAASSSTPSIVWIGAPKTAETAAASTTKAGDVQHARSVVALGDKIPDVTYEKVAAIPDKPAPSHGPVQAPMIIRGGVVGGAFSAPTPSKAQATTTAPAAAPAAAPAKATATASAAPTRAPNGEKAAAAGRSPPAAQKPQPPIPGVGEAK
ncbi:hypothetical protein [Mesorhizobium sp. INR15]|uniref:hypothetical protein n=1 Tax=Mesorhizobium sp. INR15 TaxID=2654248 RepID=UPI001896A219|nr:hypothetical protein [Mesorhizobium sp. INR15]